MSGCRRLTDAEAERVLSSVDGKIKALILVGLTYGTRISESLAMTVGDFNGDFITIQGKKKGAKQTYPITPGVKKCVQDLVGIYRRGGMDITDKTPLFCGNGDACMSRQNASQQIKKVFKRLAINGKVNTHSLRKSFVTKIYEATGKDIIRTRLFSRHSSINSLIHYIETCEDTGLVNNLEW